MKQNKTELRSVTENPCNMCMPMGGILAFKGIENAMVMIHGSQGCSTYMRRSISEHFNEPIDVASSSLNEKGTVYGGEENLKKGLNNLIKVYSPDLIGVITTCLAETIGEDIDRITTDFLAERNVADCSIIPVATPGYSGTQTEGYFHTLKTVVAKLAKDIKKHDKINVIVPLLSPADIREIKRILSCFDLKYMIFPDISDTLDSPYERPYRKIAQGGTALADIRIMAGAKATIEMAVTIEDGLSPGKYLQDTFGVPLYKMPVPIGLQNMDLFMSVLKTITEEKTPVNLRKERGRLLDGMIDSHKYNFQGRSVVFGDPELVYSMAQTCLENGVFPVTVATGSKTVALEKLLGEELAKYLPEYSILNETDFTQIRENCRKLGVNIAIGHSGGKYLEENEDIPLVRVGFPINDRVGGQRIITVGYQGTMTFLDRITNTLLENKHKRYRDEMHNKYYKKIENISSES